MAVVLGINAVFHDPAAALIIDGQTVAAAEEERFSRRKHGKTPVPFSTWEVPEQAAKWCLEFAGLSAEDVDAVGYSYDPKLAQPSDDAITDQGWEPLRTLYAERAPLFLQSALAGLDPASVLHVPHHLAHAASAWMAAPYESSSVMVLDGRGEGASYLAGHGSGPEFNLVQTQTLPHSLGLVYEEATEHLGFRRSSDEYKVMALASYGRPAFLDELRESIEVTGGGYRVRPVEWSTLTKARRPEGEMTEDHANLASSVQVRLQEVLLELAGWLHARTGDDRLTMAGGVALNCVANSFLLEHGPFKQIWVQPAAGDSGTALGAAMYLSAQMGDKVRPMPGADLGRGYEDAEIEAILRTARVEFSRPSDIGGSVGQILARNGVVGWFQGRSEFGPRALGRRSLLADPRDPGNLQRLNDIKGREQFRPIAPMVALEHAAEIFDGPIPSPYMLFVHRVRSHWAGRIPAVVHIDGTARAQTVDRSQDPLMGRVLGRFNELTGVPVVVNTSFNTAGGPMVDHPRHALEIFGSSPLDALAIGPYLVKRPDILAG